MKPKKYRLSEKTSAPAPAVQTESKKPRLKKAIILLLISLATYTALKVFIELGYLGVFIIFELCAAIPALVYIVIVRGRIGKLPTPDQLPDAWTEEERLSFLATEKRRKEDGRIYLYIAFPFIVAVLVGFVSEFYIPMFFS